MKVTLNTDASEIGSCRQKTPHKNVTNAKATHNNGESWSHWLELCSLQLQASPVHHKVQEDQDEDVEGRDLVGVDNEVGDRAAMLHLQFHTLTHYVGTPSSITLERYLMVFLMVTIVIDNVHMVDFDDFMSMRNKHEMIIMKKNESNNQGYQYNPRL